MLCDKCDKNNLCTVLCPEAELFASQDEVKPHDLPIGLPQPRPFPQFKVKTHLTKTERKIVTFWAVGLTFKEIAQQLNISYNSIKMHAYRIRKKYQK